MIATMKAMRDIADKAHEPLARRLGDTRAAELAAFVGERLGDDRPIIMVYGIYNAGKSTLLNALAGEERAAVSNRPETSKVTPHQWRDFTILDTPGIDAPQEHEEISQQQLAQADAVVFVLDSTSTFEEIRVYEELADILAARKRTIVVINNKDGLELTDPNLHSVCDKVLKNLQKICLDRRLDAGLWENMPLRVIDARAALKGRLQEKPRLVEHSGIEALERDLDRMLAQAGVSDIVNTIGTRIVKVIEDALGATGRADNTETRRIEERGDALRVAQIKVNNALAKAERRGAIRIKNKLIEACCEGQTAVEDLFASTWGDVNAVMDRELAEVQQALARHGLHVKWPMALEDSIPVPDTDSIREEVSDQNGESGVRRAFRDVGARVRDVPIHETQKTVEGVAKQILSLLKKNAPSTMRGVGKVKMDRWASTVGRYAPAVAAGLSISADLYAAHRDENTAKRKAKLIVDLTSAAASEWRASCHRVVADIVDRVFYPLDTALKKQIETLAEEDRNRAVDCRLLADLKHKTAALLEVEEELRQADSPQEA